MKLVRFGERRTGIVLDLVTGPHILDVVASIGALAPGDPISQGLLNGILKDGGSWAPLIQHWAMVRTGLRQLSRLASKAPDFPGLIIHGTAEIAAMQKSTEDDQITALEIAEGQDDFSYYPEPRDPYEVVGRVMSHLA